MPNPPTHIDIALASARALDNPVLERHLGSFLLGCTAPDVRIITRGPRSDTHFAPLDFPHIGTGMANLLQAHPRLGNPYKLNGPTRAFMAGYASHLVSDETWIVEMFRPFFGNETVYADSVLGHIMDRALQIEMDMRAAQRRQALQDMAWCLAGAETGVEVEFLPPETLAQWREWLEEAARRPFDWQRLLRMVRREYPRDDGTVEQRVNQVLASLPESLEALFQQVPSEQVDRYRETSINQWLLFLREYLS